MVPYRVYIEIIHGIPSFKSTEGHILDEKLKDKKLPVVIEVDVTICAKNDYNYKQVQCDARQCVLYKILKCKIRRDIGDGRCNFECWM